jgi:transcriptional regulator with XRE-family HTH domain
MLRMATRIGPRKPPRLFIAEWRESKGLTQEQLAQRIDTTDVTISRWETRKRQPNLDALAAIAEALDIELRDLYRLPSEPSADSLLRGQSKEVVEQAIRLIQAIRR